MTRAAEITPSSRAQGSRAATASPAERAPSGKLSTRRRLLAAGLALFAEHGPRAVTSHAIAERAGFASGTFYLHFPDKLALFRELAEEATSELEARLHAVSADLTELEDAVYAQADALVSFAEEQRDLLRIVFHPEGETHDVAARVLSRLAEGVCARRRECTTASLTADCFDPEVLAQAIVGMWAHVLAWWAEDPSRAKRSDLVRTLTHFQLHGNRSIAGDLCGLADSRSEVTTSRSALPLSPTPPAGDPTP